MSFLKFLAALCLALSTCLLPCSMPEGRLMRFPDIHGEQDRLLLRRRPVAGF